MDAPQIDAWTHEPDPVPEKTFTPWADDTWHAWNMWSAETEFCDQTANLIAELEPKLVVETGVGQGFLTRRILARHDGSYIGYEKENNWREAIRPYWPDNPRFVLSDQPTPTVDIIRQADLLILDTEWVTRVNEFMLWLEHGKPGSHLIIHDTGQPGKHAATSMHMNLHRLVYNSGIEGEWGDNPRGSWHGTMPDNYQTPYTDKPQTVCVAFTHAGPNLHGDFAASLLHTALNNHGLITATAIRQSGPMIHIARNSLVEMFLKTDADWLWMIDTDMVFPPDALNTLLKDADPITNPITGGLCFTYGPQQTATTMYRFDNGLVAKAETYPQNAVIQVDATGTAFILIHRKVLENMAQHIQGPAPWFDFTQDNNRIFGEDITFCVRARQLGYPVTVNTAAKIGHLKTQTIDETAYQTWRENHHFVLTGDNQNVLDRVADMLDSFGIPTGKKVIFYDDIYDQEWGGWRGEASVEAKNWLDDIPDNIPVVHIQPGGDFDPSDFPHKIGELIDRINQPMPHTSQIAKMIEEYDG